MNNYISFSTNDNDLTFLLFKKRSLQFIESISTKLPYCNKLFLSKLNTEINLSNSTLNEDLYKEINDEEVAYINVNRSNKNLDDNSLSPFGFKLDFSTKKESEGLGFWFSLFGGNDGKGGGKIEFVGEVENGLLTKMYNEILLIIIEVYKPVFAYITNPVIRKEVRVRGEKNTCGIYSYVNKRINSLLPNGFVKEEVLGNDALIKSTSLNVSIDDIKKIQAIVNNAPKGWDVFDGIDDPHAK